MILPSFLCTLLVLGIAGSPIPDNLQKVVASIQHHRPSNLAWNSEIPKVFVDRESMAYNTCKSYRGKSGLTWKDVEICEKKNLKFRLLKKECTYLHTKTSWLPTRMRTG